MARRVAADGLAAYKRIYGDGIYSNHRPAGRLSISDTGSPFRSTYIVTNDTADPSVPSPSLEPELVVLGVMLIPVRLAELMDAAVLYARPETD